MLHRTRRYRFLYFSLSSSVSSCSRVGSSRDGFAVFFIDLNLSSGLNQLPQCFLVCQQFGRSGSDLLPVGIRIRVYFLAVRLCLLPDLGGLFCRLLLDNAADGILLAADPLDIFQILLRAGNPPLRFAALYLCWRG